MKEYYVSVYDIDMEDLFRRREWPLDTALLEHINEIINGAYTGECWDRLVSQSAVESGEASDRRLIYTFIFEREKPE